jgi:hypothetical protein
MMKSLKNMLLNRSIPKSNQIFTGHILGDSGKRVLCACVGGLHLKTPEIVRKDALHVKSEERESSLSPRSSLGGRYIGAQLAEGVITPQRCWFNC